MSETVSEDYVGPVWHAHHEILIEWCYSFGKRERYIRETKAQDESSWDIRLRLRLFKPVKGKLPEAVCKAHDALIKAREAANKAGSDLNKANAARHKANAARHKANAARQKADAAWERANTVYNKADAARHKALTKFNTILQAHHTQILALHAQECPNCPWNGKTIFPERIAAA
jgi:hypothetical protein